MAQTAFAAGVAALNQGNTTTAVEKFNEALKADPDLTEAYINRGIARLRLDQPVEAVGDFDKALELTPIRPKPFTTGPWPTAMAASMTRPWPITPRP